MVPTSQDLRQDQSREGDPAPRYWRRGINYEQRTNQIKLESGKGFVAKSQIHPTEGFELRYPSAGGAAANPPHGAEADDEINYHESGDLSAEDPEENRPVLPEIPISTTAKVSIEDLQMGDSGSATSEEIEKLRHIIWKKQHLVIGKENALPPATRGVICGINFGNAKPIALRSRKVPTRFREKVAGLIKGLLAVEIIRPSTLP
ncbi:reverse transcriptase [Phytophthora megakarya]|uniref:Reverse transcriptase n=1 Tax=Phytophthora megakarya TaxID=4795 RepID=A0A225W2H1_9STRA|nr:reverse transcriptase [Phytophthora megakarya]